MSAEVISGGGGSPKLQAKTVSPSTSSQNITPDSGYDGLSRVTVNAMPTGSLNGIGINSNGLITSSVGTSGYLSSGTNKTLQLPTQGSTYITPASYSQTAVSNGKYTTGNIYVNGDNNLIPSNIRNGVSIFGVNGNYTGESSRQKGATGMLYNASGNSFTINTGDSSLISSSQIIALTVLPKYSEFTNSASDMNCCGCLYDSRIYENLADAGMYTFYFDGDTNSVGLNTLNNQYSISVSNGIVTVNLYNIYDSAFIWPSTCYWSVTYSS